MLGVAGAKPLLERVARNEVRARGRLPPYIMILKKKRFHYILLYLFFEVCYGRREI
jgi:hypothetical protein